MEDLIADIVEGWGCLQLEGLLVLNVHTYDRFLQVAGAGLEFVIGDEYLGDPRVRKDLFSDLDGKDGTYFLVNSVAQRAILLMKAFGFVFLDKLGLLIAQLKIRQEWRPVGVLLVFPPLARTCRNKVSRPLIYGSRGRFWVDYLG